MSSPFPGDGPQSSRFTDGATKIPDPLSRIYAIVEYRGQTFASNHGKVIFVCTIRSIQAKALSLPFSNAQLIGLWLNSSPMRPLHADLWLHRQYRWCKSKLCRQMGF